MVTESVSSVDPPTPEDLLHGLSQDRASGVLEIRHALGQMSHVWVREGRIYAMQVPGYRPVLGIRLLSGGLVSPEQLSAAAVEQRERFPNDLIGQVLVAMDFVGPEVIDAFVLEQVLDQLADLLDLRVEGSTFHSGRLVQHDIIPPTEVDELLAVARQRRSRRTDVLESVGGPDVVPVLGPPGQGTAHTPLGPDEWALLCRVDGQRDITELARVCGFTVQESAQIVVDLCLTGLLHLREPEDEEEGQIAPVVALHPAAPFLAPAPQWQFVGTDAGEPEPVGDLLAEFSAFVHDDPLAAEEDFALPEMFGMEQPTRTYELDQGPMDHVELHEAWEPVSQAPIAEAPIAPPTHRTLQPAAPVAAAPEGAAAEAVAPAEAVAVPQEPIAAAPVADTAIEPAAEPNPQDPQVWPPVPVGTVPPGPSQAQPATPAASTERAGYSDTSVFMRELSSLSGDSTKEAGEEEQAVTRLVVPLTEQRKKRRFWKR